MNRHRPNPDDRAGIKAGGGDSRSFFQPGGSSGLAGEADHLRRLLRDLTAVMALPSLWVDKDPQYILDSLLNMLVRTLALDAAHVRLEQTGRPHLEATAPARLAPGQLRPVRSLAGDPSADERHGGRPSHQSDADVRVHGPGAMARLTASAARDGFPNDHDLFLLRAAVNQALIMLRQARLVAEARLSDAQKSDFIAQLGHELRNPLEPILGGAELIHAADDQTEGTRRAASMIRRQAHHMSKMLDDLLDVSRIGRDGIALRTETLDLVRLLRAVTDDRQPALAERSIEVRTSFPANPVWVDGDPTRLSQIVDNLLVNAGKFTPPGGWVAVELAVEERPAGVVVRVSDSGIGFEPDQAGGLFEPFAHGRQAAHVQPGLGIGLALALGLARAHGGDLMASSAGPDRGATFTLRMPGAAPEPAREPPAAPGVERMGLRVLVVDDNPDVAESLALIVDALGHAARVAATGIDALATLRAEPADVVLCDIGLPDPLDGLALAQQLRANPATSGLTLIAVSGYGQDEDRRRSREAGFDLHLTKPVGLTMLEQVLSSLPTSSSEGPTAGVSD